MNKYNLVPNIRFKNFEDEWKNLKLGELSEIARGASPRPINNKKWFSKNSKIGWLRISDVTEQNGRIFYLKQKLSIQGQKKTRVIKTRHLLLSIAATVGSPVINYIPTGVHDGFLIFYNPKFDIEFMFQWLQKYRKNWSKFGQPGSQVNLNSKIVKNQKVYIPEEKEERDIANLFLKIDRLLDLQQQKIDKLGLLKKALLQKLFPKHDTKIPELRFKGFEYEWESYLLGKIAVFINGRAFKQNELLNKGKYPVLRVGNFYTNDKWFYSDLELPEKLYANKGDLLYTWSATFGPHIWKGDKVIYHYHIWKIIFSSEVSKQFALQMLLNDKEELMNNTNGSTMIHLTKNEMEKKVVKIPIKQEQQKIGNLLSKVDQLIELENKKLQNFQQVKKCLLQNMFVE